MPASLLGNSLQVEGPAGTKAQGWPQASYPEGVEGNQAPFLLLVPGAGFSGLLPQCDLRVSLKHLPKQLNLSSKGRPTAVSKSG